MKFQNCFKIKTYNEDLSLQIFSVNNGNLQFIELISKKIFTCNRIIILVNNKKQSISL